MESTTLTPADDAGRLDLQAEDGAQAVEYAMIGGLGAGTIGLLWTIISRTGLFDRIVESLLSSLVDLVTSWF
jgi:Flp pilus assembly pilin Flp